MKINFSLNKETSEFKKPIKELYNSALKVLNLTNKISINLALVSDEEIKKLNNQYRGIDRVTDVLSFPMVDDITKIESEPDFEFGDCNIGDVYINLQRAKEQADEYGHSLKREFCFLALHGFLHLLGFDHMNDKDEKEMFALQDNILKLCDVERI